MHARLPLECGPCAIARNFHHPFANPANARFADRIDFALPPLSFGIAQVGAEKFAGKDAGLVAASTRAHFNQQVSAIVWIGLQKEAWEPLQNVALNRLSLDAVGGGKFAHLRICPWIRLE